MSSPLIINGIYCPEPDFDGYNAYESILREQVPMISGRLVEEVRGKVWRINYASGRIRDSVVQQLLAARGYYTGDCDGIFGELTKRAVMAYQADAGLETDGEVGGQTWAKLIGG